MKYENILLSSTVYYSSWTRCLVVAGRSVAVCVCGSLCCCLVVDTVLLRFLRVSRSSSSAYIIILFLFRFFM